MSGGKIDIKDLPLCTDSDLHRYRVIGWKARSGNINSDVVPGDYIAGKGEYSPSSIYSKVIQEYYGPFHACRLGNASYLVFEKPLSFGGNEKPYTNVPLCEKGQSLRRALLRPGQDDPDCQDRPNLQKCLPMGTDRHEMALVPSHRLDPHDSHTESLKKYLWEADAKGLCQKKNPADKWALYWVDHNYHYLKKKLESRLAQVELKLDPESENELTSRIDDELPEVYRRCIVFSEAEEHDSMVLMDKRKSFFEKREDPSISNGTVPGLAELLIAEAKYYDLSGDKHKLLENIISLGLHNSISDEFMLSAVRDLTSHTANEQALLYGLLAVVMLEIAKRLHESNLAEGGPGISPEFSDFVTAVDEAIRDGRISLREKDILEELFHPIAFALYNPIRNEIICPIIYGSDPLELYLDAIVHECVHAYQDMLAKPLTAVETEFHASASGLRAAALFGGFYVFDEHARFALGLGSLQTNQIYRMYSNERFRCLGYDSEMLNHYNRLDDKIALLVSAWHIEALGHPRGSGVLGHLSERSAVAFSQAEGLRSLATMFEELSFKLLIKVGRLFDKSKLANNKKIIDELRVNMQMAEEGLSEAKFIFDVAPGSAKHAKAASDYLYFLSVLSAHAYYLDRKRWKELYARFYKEAGFLAESLQYLMFFQDGV